MWFFKLGSLTNDKVINIKSVQLDSDDLKKLFFNGWKTNQTKVSLELESRGINDLADISHWAWILKSDGLKEDNFFCSIEYSDKGIVIRTYDEFDDIENACRGCMGDSDKVF